MMKRVVSVSIGSSRRDKAVEIELLGERLSLERIGTDGDMERAAHLYRELDGRVAAFGMGGTDLGLMVNDRFYPLYSARRMARFVKETPLVDGTGLKNTLENRVGPFLIETLGDYIAARGKKAFVTAGVDRWGMSRSLLESGFACVFGDLMFGLGVPVAVRSKRALVNLARVLMPVVGRLPYKWLYPTGEKQEKRVPKWERYYNWATVVAGDCNYIRRHLPRRLPGKIIATNTTTPADVALFREAGVKYLVTSTPVLDGRSFGTNMMEAALVAASGLGRALTRQELSGLLDRLGLSPQMQELG